MRTGVATWDEALQLFLERSGFAEETYHTFSYSPLTDEDGRIAGMLCVVSEETERVIGERRLATLRDLGSVALDADRGRGARDRVAPPGRQRARRAVRAHLPLRRGRGRSCAPRPASRRTIPSRATRCGRSAASWSSSTQGDLPTGAWDEPPFAAVVLPFPRRARALGRLPGRRAEPLPAARRRVPRLPRAGRGPDRGGDRERAGVRGRAPARRGAGRARPREDRVLHQRQPRAADAADAAAGPGRGRADRRRRRWSSRTASASRSSTATRSGC